MTQLLFYSAFAFGLGYLCGKCFKGLNPFLMIVGGLVIFIPSAQFLISVDSYLYTSAFIVGFLYNYGNPFRRLSESFEELKLGWMLHRATAKASDNLNRQKADFEADLNRQRREAEEQIREQERQAAEKLRREAENLRRQQEEFRREQKNNHREQSSHSTEEKPDSRSYEEILGLKPGYTKEDLKRAYRQQCARLHPDKWQDRPAHIRKAMEEEQKRVNEAYKKLNEQSFN